MSPLDWMVIEMEFSRCKMVAVNGDDPRCSDLLTGVAIEMEDSRCTSLAEGRVLELNDARSRHMHVKMEDPRCQNLYMKW
jgi:hypothetical protein